MSESVFNSNIFTDRGSSSEPQPHPDPVFKIHDKVVLNDPPNKWGLPLDFDPATVLRIKKKPIPIYVGGTPRWVHTVAYGDYWYEIWEQSLKAAAD